MQPNALSRMITGYGAVIANLIVQIQPIEQSLHMLTPQNATQIIGMQTCLLQGCVFPKVEKIQDKSIFFNLYH